MIDADEDERAATALLDREGRSCRRFGWTALACWATFGLALEAAHGLKLASYLDDGLTHTLLRLAHAHGVGLALVLLLFAAAVGPLHGRPAPAESRAGAARAARRTGRCLRAAASLMPMGFALSAVGHGEGDPSVPIAAVPVGAAFLVLAAARAAFRAWRER